MEPIFIYGNNTYGVVKSREIEIGDKVDVSFGTKPLIKFVTEIIEQRPEKGVRKNEADRRIWAKVIVQ